MGFGARGSCGGDVLSVGGAEVGAEFFPGEAGFGGGAAIEFEFSAEVGIAEGASGLGNEVGGIVRVEDVEVVFEIETLRANGGGDDRGFDAE